MAKGKGKKSDLDLLARAGQNGARPDEVTLSTGVKLRLKKFPRIIIADSIRAVEDDFGGRPKPPIVLIPDKGREEDNPDDPDYKARLERLEALMAQAFADVLIMHGTELKASPKTVKTWDDPEWHEALRASRIPVPEYKLARYTLWVKHVAAAHDEDYAAILGGVARLIGVPEGDVAAAVDSFRGDEAGETDPGVSAE